MACTSPYCEGNENFFRVSALLIEEGTKALRIIFDQRIKHSHGTLEAALKLPPVEKLMKNFLHGSNGEKRLLYPNQYNLLYPGPGKCAVSTSFDITLLNFLYRTLLRITNNWPSRPSDSDLSLPADVARITIIRNEVFGHITNTKLSADEFDCIWIKLETILKRLNVSENDISSWKNKTLLPEEKAQYESELNSLIQQDFLFVQDTLRIFQDCTNLLCSKLDDLQLSETTVSDICNRIEGVMENNNKGVTQSMCSLANSLENVIKELKNNCCKDDINRLYKNLNDDLKRLFQVQASEEELVNVRNEINQLALHNNKQTTKILQGVNEIKEEIQNRVKPEEATTNVPPSKPWPDTNNPKNFLNRRNAHEGTSQLCSWSLPFISIDKTAILSVSQTQLQFIDVKLSGAPKSDGNMYSSINEEQERNIIWETPTSVSFVSEKSSEFFINKDACVVASTETCRSSEDAANERQNQHTKIDVLFASKKCDANQKLMDGNRVCGGVIVFCDETLNQWCVIFADERILKPGPYGYKVKNLLQQPDTSTVTLCLDMEFQNIMRVVHSEHLSIGGLVDELRSWQVITGEQTISIKDKHIDISMKKKLCAELEKCTPGKFRRFIALLKFIPETFSVGCQVGHSFENLKTLHMTGSADKSGVNEMKYSLTLNQSRQTEELCKNLVKKEKEDFCREVVGITSEETSETIKVTSGSIKITLQIKDMWELENLKKNIICGLFLKEYSEWIHKNGGKMDEELVKITLMSEDTVVAEYSGQTPKLPPGSHHTSLGVSESEESVPSAAVDSTRERKELNDVLTDTRCKIIKMILQSEDAPSPQRLAIALETENIVQYLQHEDKATINKIIEDLSEKLCILNCHEYVKLQEMLENCGKKECLFNVAAFIEDKTPLEIERFVNFLIERDILRELGMHISKVLDYSKITKKFPTKWDRKTVQVTGYNDITEEILELIYQNKEKSGGGPTASIKLDKYTNTSFITFQDETDATGVLKQERVKRRDGSTLYAMKPYPELRQEEVLYRRDATGVLKQERVKRRDDSTLYAMKPYPELRQEEVPYRQELGNIHTQNETKDLMDKDKRLEHITNKIGLVQTSAHQANYNVIHVMQHITNSNIIGTSSCPQLSHLMELPAQPSEDDYVFSPAVKHEEKQFCQILDNDHQQKLQEIAKEVGGKQGTMDLKNLSGFAMLQVWQVRVMSGNCTWRQFYDILIKLKCDAAAEQFKAVFEKNCLVTELELLKYYLPLKDVLGEVVSKGIINLTERNKIRRMEESESVEYLVLDLLMKRPHVYIQSFHSILYTARHFKQFLDKLMLCPEDIHNM